MKTITIEYRGWIITSQSSGFDVDDGQVLYEGIAEIEIIARSLDPKRANQEANLRRRYGVRGRFSNEAKAQQGAIAAATLAIDLLDT